MENSRHIFEVCSLNMKITKMQMIFSPQSYKHDIYYAIWLLFVRLYMIGDASIDEFSVKSKWNCVKHTPNADQHA